MSVEWYAELHAALVDLGDARLDLLARATGAQATRYHDQGDQPMADVFLALAVAAGRLAAEQRRTLREAADAAEGSGPGPSVW